MGRRGNSSKAAMHLPQDKVRIKDGADAGRRGIIREVVGHGIMVALDGDEAIVLVSLDSVQNYSLAARKAWKTNPNRVGIGGRKPKSERPRLPVAFRVDPLVWDLLKEAEKRGLIANRTDAINEWILAGVTALLRDAAPVQVAELDDARDATVVPFVSKGR